MRPAFSPGDPVTAFEGNRMNADQESDPSARRNREQAGRVVLEPSGTGLVMRLSGSCAVRGTTRDQGGEACAARAEGLAGCRK